MHSHTITLKGTSLEERTKLKQFLESKEEKVFEGSCAFKLKNFGDSYYFYYDLDRKNWKVDEKEVSDSTKISIEDFINKFSIPIQKPNLTFFNRFHPQLRKLIETTEMHQVVLECETSFKKFFFRKISSQYDIIDELNQQLIDIKKKHLDEILEVKTKLNDAIELNYKLYMELNKNEQST